jgi:hypothetical protein
MQDHTREDILCGERPRVTTRWIAGAGFVLLAILSLGAGFKDSPAFRKAFEEKLKQGQTAEEVRKLLGSPSRVRHLTYYLQTLDRKAGILLSYEIEYDTKGNVETFDVNLDSDAEHAKDARDWPALRHKFLAELQGGDRLVSDAKARQEVEARLGKPARKTQEEWLYSEDRKPGVGECVEVYSVEFGPERRVIDKKAAPGACVTGTAPSGE